MLRPLRLMGRNAGMRSIVGALVWSAKPIVFALGFLLLIVMIFSVLGMAIFKDMLHACTDGSLRGDLGEGVFECVNIFVTSSTPATQFAPGTPGGVLLPRVWKRPLYNFDNFPFAALSLCRVLTLKWVSVWQGCIDAAGEGIQPVPGINTPAASAFFIIFVFIGSFFSVNLFVSFVVDGFYAAQGLDNQFAEIQYASIQSMIQICWPATVLKPPTNALSRLCRRIVDTPRFALFSCLCIMVNVVCMSMNHEGEDTYFAAFLDIQNNVFFGIMCFEFLLTIIGFGAHICFTNGQYQFDLFLILSSVATATLVSSFRSSAQVVRVLRLFRFLKVLSRSKLVSNVLETVSISMRQVTLALEVM
ncbi:Ion transport protein-domain-containing protein [Baffinella frigidus]|nr:Ion transport protein-domain-containing protein [Cryptophyta sp. CCMP2293]